MKDIKNNKTKAGNTVGEIPANKGLENVVVKCIDPSPTLKKNAFYKAVQYFDTVQVINDNGYSVVLEIGRFKILK